MAIRTRIGGIRLNEQHFTSILPIDRLMSFSIPGMAFEAKDLAGENYDHLDQRVAELRPARSDIQRSFFAPAMRTEKEVDPETGKKVSVRKPTGWTPTAKHRNATGGLRRFIEGPFLESPPLSAVLPGFILYCPEALVGEQLPDFDAHQGGEFFIFELDEARKFMVADGESRHMGIELALSPSSKLSGSQREKLRNTLVVVDFIHGIAPTAMGQIFADLNARGVKLSPNEAESLNIRDPWVRATREIFDKLREEEGYDITLQRSGRQVTAAAQAEGKHLLFSQTVTMVRAMGTGSYSKAVSSSSLEDAIIKEPKQYDRIVRGGVGWFKVLLNRFQPVVGKDEDPVSIFTHPDYVLRAMPIKVALGVMGHAWVETNLPLQAEHGKSLEKINWRVDERWGGIAGKVALKTKKVKNAEGKTVKEEIPDEWELAAASAKQIGPLAVRALTNASTNVGRRVRGLPLVDDAADTVEETAA
jgi:hypothetical protein